MVLISPPPLTHWLAAVSIRKVRDISPQKSKNRGSTDTQNTERERAGGRHQLVQIKIKLGRSFLAELTPYLCCLFSPSLINGRYGSVCLNAVFRLSSDRKDFKLAIELWLP